MTTFRDTTRVQRAVGLAEVPPAKWRNMVKRTFAGGSVVALAWAAGGLWGAPWYVPTAIAMLGVQIWAGQLVNRSIKHAIPLVRELVSAVKGGKSDG